MLRRGGGRRVRERDRFETGIEGTHHPVPCEREHSAIQFHVSGGEEDTAHSTDGSRVSRHNLDVGNKPSYKNKGSRSMEEYQKMYRIGEGQYGQVQNRQYVLVLTLLFYACALVSVPICL